MLKNYDIDISKLDLGQYEFLYQLSDEFFELFDYSLVKEGSFSSKIVLEKKSTFLTLNFDIQGSVNLICDRSLDSFEQEIEIQKELVLKFGEEAKEVSDEIEIIPFNAHRINVARYLYDFISVAIPMKKLHPRYKDDPDDNQIIFSSNSDEEQGTDVDPRWSELKKLKHKK